MKYSNAFAKWIAAIIITLILPGICMAQFGSAIAIQGDQVFVMKPGGAFGGLAVVTAFEQDANGDWYPAERLITQDALESGTPLSNSMWVQNDILYVGAGDPAGDVGAYVFEQQDGLWGQGDHLQLQEFEDKGIPEQMAISDFMSYVQPPRRMGVSHGEKMAIGVTQGPQSRVGVFVFEKEAGNWEVSQRLQDPFENRRSRFGASVALDENHMVVGAPGLHESGRAFVYEKGDADWVLLDTLKVAELEKGAGFGNKVLISASKIFVAAPGADEAQGAIYVFDKNDNSNTLTKQTVLRLSMPSPRAALGAEMILAGNTLWASAPNAEGKGQVVVYPDINDLDNSAANAITITGAQEGGRFGAAIGVTEGLAVIGSPSGHGGFGEAVVFEKNGEGNWVEQDRLYHKEVLSAVSGKEMLCESGKAGTFDCDGVDLLSYMPMDSFGAAFNERVSDVWGWTDPETGHEYALLGRTGGAAIIDVTNPILPAYIGLVPANPTPTRDLKVYKDHLFFTGDGAGDHGLVIFDLTRLRDLNQTPMSLEPDTIYTGIASAHNLIIDEESGYAYPVGASRGGETCGGGLHMVNIQEPQSPEFAGCFTDTIGLFSDGRTHDGQCLVYSGPDNRYAGREICFVSNETALRIVDVTDKSKPEPLSAARYPRVAYVHQGWITDDHRYFYLDDELDELVGMTENTRTMVWDIAELDDPVLVAEFQGSTTATDHNLYVKGDRMYQANYQAGLRIWDISDPESPVEIGFFDTTPNYANPPGFVGAWTAYPYFESGTIVVSSMNEGLFLVRPSQEEMP